MGELQLLVSTMYREDNKLYYDINAKTDVVIANQSDVEAVNMDTINGNVVHLITTKTRGVSKNRNIAIDNISPNAKIVMFSDDDLCFFDDYEKVVLEEFKKHPDAEAIKFNIKLVSGRKLAMQPTQTFHRVGRRDVTSWGVCALAIKSHILKEKCLRFNERFGPGTTNSSGEDTIFLQDMIKKGVKTFTSPEYVAGIKQDESSWFKGYNASYFINQGKVLSECYPLLSYLLVIRSAYKFSKRVECKLGLLKILTLYIKGISLNQKEKKLM